MKQPDKKTKYYKFSALEEIFDEYGKPQNVGAWLELERMAYTVVNTFFKGRHEEAGVEIDDLAHIALLNGILSGRKAILRRLKTKHGWSLVWSGMRWGVANYLSRQKKQRKNENLEQNGYIKKEGGGR